MSGPKVIRIVTRAEIIEICEGHLARLDTLIQEWTRVGSRNGVISDADVSAVKARRDAIQRLLTGDKFLELQKQVPEEIDFLRTDIAARLDKAVAAEADARSARRRLGGTAATLLGALERANKTVPEELKRALIAAQSNGAGAERTTEAAIARAFALLAPEEKSGSATARQKDLAEKLSDGTGATTLAEWVGTQAQLVDDEEAKKIDRYIAELQLLEGRDVAAPFAQRAMAIAQELSTGRRKLLSDSLVLDLAAAAKARRVREETRLRLLEVRSEVQRQSGPSAFQLLQEVETAIAAGETGRGQRVLMEAATFLAEEAKRFASVARRDAVLKGLAALGYEVREGMATAWAQNGRIVLRKAASPEYGVEVGGNEQGERLQFRVVAFGSVGAARDEKRDRDMETIWCTELERMQVLIAKAGGAIAIERALPVGAVALKVIEDASGAGRDVEVGTPRARTLT